MVVGFVVSVVLSFPAISESSEVPPNAYAYGEGSICNEGYKRNSDRTGCIKIKVPPKVRRVAELTGINSYGLLNLT
tara:strand:- start:1512 stop:1739 length:228 start_codon:yes stop_codon:yes gene_type:complete